MVRGEAFEDPFGGFDGDVQERIVEGKRGIEVYRRLGDGQRDCCGGLPGERQGRKCEIGVVDVGMVARKSGDASPLARLTAQEKADVCVRVVQDLWGRMSRGVEKIGMVDEG